MTDISKIERWALAMFPDLEWQDKNGNGRIEKSELFVFGRPTVEEAKELGRKSEAVYIPLIESIEKNGDGISFEEIMDYIRPEGKYVLDFVWDQIRDGLRGKGAYEMPKAPVMFVTDETIPKEVEKIPEADGKIKGMKENKRPYAWMLSRKDGKISGRTDKGSEKYCLVIVPKILIEGEENNEMAKAFMHELMHAWQYFSGGLREIDSIRILLSRSGGFDKETFEAVESLDAQIAEISPLLREAEFAIERKDFLLALINCMEMNRVFAAINHARQKLKEAKLDKIEKAVAEIFDEIFPVKENNRRNKQLFDLVRENEELIPKCRLKRDILPKAFLALYDKELEENQKNQDYILK